MSELDASNDKLEVRTVLKQIWKTLFNVGDSNTREVHFFKRLLKRAGRKSRKQAKGPFIGGARRPKRMNPAQLTAEGNEL